MARPCLFCPAKATTKEHAWPEWIAKQLGLRQQYFQMVAEAGRLVPRKQPISIASYRRKMLCDGCQQHYHDLEDRAMPILLSMARGELTPIWAGERSVLAEWGAKTAYTVFDFHGISDDLPERHRYGLRESGTPADDVFVGYVPYQGPPRSTFTYLPLDPHQVEHPPPLAPAGYSYVGAFGNVALKVFGIVNKLPDDVIEADPRLIHQVWPRIDNDTAWPILGPWPIPDQSNETPPIRAPLVGNDLLRLAMYVPVSGRPHLWEWEVPGTPPHSIPPVKG